MRKLVITFALVILAFIGCTKQQNPMEKLQADLDSAKAQRERVYAEREKMFSGEASLDAGKVSYDSKSGKRVSGKNPYKEFVSFLKQNSKAAEVEMKFNLSFRGKDKQVITVQYDRVRTFVSVSSSLGASKYHTFESEGEVVKWAEELAGYNSSLWLGLD